MTLPSQREFENAFIALEAKKGLAAGAIERPVLFADVALYIAGHKHSNTHRIEAAIRADLRVRKLFKLLLEEQRRSFTPRQALAMGTEEISDRSCRGFELKLRASRAATEQVYVVLEIWSELQKDDDSAAVLLLERENVFCRLVFPAIQDGRTQTILPSASKTLAMLRDANTALSLI